MTTLDIKTTTNDYSLTFTAESALICKMTSEAIKSYFINKWAYYDFMNSLEHEILNPTYPFIYSNLYHLDGKNILASNSLRYKYTLKDGNVKLLITHFTKED